MNQKGFANILLIILVIVLTGTLGYMTFVKQWTSNWQLQSNNSQNTQFTTPSPSNNTISQNPPSSQPPVNTSRIDCGVIKIKDASQQSVQIACMNKALHTCTAAIMYYVPEGLVYSESYEILGSKAQYCQVAYLQHAKPPRVSSVCKYPLELILKTNSMLESQHEAEKLFPVVVMQNVQNSEFCKVTP